jgi:hypothetical protein
MQNVNMIAQLPNFDTNIQQVQNLNSNIVVSNSGLVQNSATFHLNTNPSSHFEFPDYSTAEVSVIIGLGLETKEISDLGSLATAH